MTKLNENICSNCGISNPLYLKNCSNCKHYIRKAVINIDLWHTIYQIFEDPKKAIKNIIYAEHKNFMVFLLLFVSVKFFFFSSSIQSALNTSPIDTNFTFYNLLIVPVIFVLLILFCTKVLTIFLNKLTKTRFKDNLALIVYSSIPMIFALFILTPVEYGIFGEHWFIFNPSPFIIKSNLAYLLTGLEILMIFWSISIFVKAMHIQSNSKLFSFLSATIMTIIFISALLFIPFILF